MDSGPVILYNRRFRTHRMQLELNSEHDWSCTSVDPDHQAGPLGPTLDHFTLCPLNSRLRSSPILGHPPLPWRRGRMLLLVTSEAPVADSEP